MAFWLLLKSSANLRLGGDLLWLGAGAEADEPADERAAVRADAAGRSRLWR